MAYLFDYWRCDKKNAAFVRACVDVEPKFGAVWDVFIGISGFGLTRMPSFFLFVRLNNLKSNLFLNIQVLLRPAFTVILPKSHLLSITDRIVVVCR